MENVNENIMPIKKKIGFSCQKKWNNTNSAQLCLHQYLSDMKVPTFLLVQNRNVTTCK